MDQTTSLQDRFFPIKTSLPSCIGFQKPVATITLSSSLNTSNTLPKFHDLKSEDVYFFIREFVKVCLMMRMPRLGDDTVRLCFIPFSLKDLDKKCLYSLAVDSVTS